VVERAEKLVLLASSQPLHGRDDTGGNSGEARCVTPTMKRLGTTRWVVPALLLVAAVLLFTPVHAQYVEYFDYDVVGIRSASCGPPVVTIAHNDPGLGGGQALPIGAVNARNACGRAAGVRVAGGFSLLLVIALAWSLTRVRAIRRPRTPEEQHAATGA
jgi:hypothetical protein